MKNQNSSKTNKPKSINMKFSPIILVLKISIQKSQVLENLEILNYRRHPYMNSAHACHVPKSIFGKVCHSDI